MKIENLLIKTYLVALSHGEWKHKSKIQNFLDNINCDNYDVIYVDTSKKNDNKEINEAYEFSGYQYGLIEIIKNYLLFEDTKIKIVFINDTLFEAHIPLMSTLLSYVINRVNPDSFSIIGLKQDTPSPYVGEDDYFYAPTFCFAICGEKKDLIKIKFYDVEICDPVDFEKKWDKLAIEYKNSIDNWLNPRRFLSGWYKSVPWRRLDSGTYFRKRLCIYFEHCLLSRLNGVSCKKIFINDVKKFQIFVLLLMFFDRLFVNYKKIIFRFKEKFYV